MNKSNKNNSKGRLAHRAFRQSSGTVLDRAGIGVGVV